MSNRNAQHVRAAQHEAGRAHSPKLNANFLARFTPDADDVSAFEAFPRDDATQLRPFAKIKGWF